MTSASRPEQPPARPVPDTEDLRILAELVRGERVSLAQAAWNARMDPLAMAARLLTMAERGLPLRLVVEGDREQLWRIAQAGPATAAFELPRPDAGDAGPPDWFVEAGRSGLSATSGARPDWAPPVLPHEQAIAGAAPLGSAPFGAAGPDTDPDSTPPDGIPAVVATGGRPTVSRPAAR